MTNITRRDALALLGSASAALGLAACGGSSDSASDTTTDAGDTTYKIGVLQLIEHEATGNDAAALRRVQADINDYLINR